MDGRMLTAGNDMGAEMTTIVRPSAAGRVTRFAAQELADYLSRMTATKIPVGEAAAPPAIRLELAPDDGNLAAVDAFAIREHAGVVTLRSATPRGLLLAAYGYLSRLGCRFLMPGRDGEFVPACREPILRGIDTVESPPSAENRSSRQTPNWRSR